MSRHRLTLQQREHIQKARERWWAWDLSTEPTTLDACIAAAKKIPLVAHQRASTVLLDSPRAIILEMALAGECRGWPTYPDPPGPVQNFLNLGSRRLVQSSMSRRLNVWGLISEQIASDLETCPMQLCAETLQKKMGEVPPLGVLSKPIMGLAHLILGMISPPGSYARLADVYLNILDREEYRVFEGLIDLEEISFWYIMEKTLWISQKPCEIHVDARQRLHNDKGPAIRFRDGFAVYALHGVRVPQRIVEDPKSITVEQIQTESNAEVARIMLMQLGEENFLPHFTAKGRPFRGSQLYEASLGERPLARVRCLNSTPEPDGSRKVYWLKVRPGHSCAQEALASIHINPWRTDWRHYKPSVET